MNEKTDIEVWFHHLRRWNLARTWQFAERLTSEQYDRLCEETSRELSPGPVLMDEGSAPTWPRLSRDEGERRKPHSVFSVPIG